MIRSENVEWHGVWFNKLIKTSRRSLFPSSVIDIVERKSLNNYFIPDSSQRVAREDNCLYFKLPYIGAFSITTQLRVKILVSTFCSDVEIKLVFTRYKMKSWLGAKDPIPAGLRSQVIQFVSSHVQAVVLVTFVKPIDTSPLTSVNISPPTNLPTSLNT